MQRIKHMASILINQQQELYDHHTGQHALAGISVKNWRIFLQQSFIVHIHMPLLTVQNNSSYQDF